MLEVGVYEKRTSNTASDSFAVQLAWPAITREHLPCEAFTRFRCDVGFRSFRKQFR